MKRKSKKPAPAAAPKETPEPAQAASSPKPKHAGGRPRSITAEVVEEVGELMSLGVPERHACAFVGVNPDTFGPVVSRTEEFKAIMLKHHAKFMVESLQIIKAGGERVTVTTADGPSEKILPWTGRAWILERRYKPHFNKTDQHALSKPDGSGGLMSESEMAELERMTKTLVKGMTQ